MGLYVHSLGELPANAERAYYIYVLDYGWHERLGEALEKNLPKMMDLASRHDAVVIKGIDSTHFDDEVFSFHSIDGERGDEILPAILITSLHPKYFKEKNHRYSPRRNLDDKLLLIPLRKICSTSEEVVSLISKIFSDIKEKKQLTEFSVYRQLNKGKFRTAMDALILEPNFSGVGIDLKKIGDMFKGNNDKQ